MDPREVGKYSLEMYHDDGEVIPLSGRYIQIDHPHRLVMTWTWGSGRFAGQGSAV